MKKNSKFSNKKTKKTLKILYLLNFFNKFLTHLRKIGKRKKQGFKNLLKLISKLPMKKVMKNITFGMIKKYKTKLYHKEKLLKVGVIH